MVPPPKRVDSVEVSNKTAKALTVTVVYENVKDNTDILESASVDAGSQHVFGGKEVDCGSYKAVAPVKHVKVADEGYEHLLEPQVSGIVKVLAVSLLEVGGKPQLQQM